MAQAKQVYEAIARGEHAWWLGGMTGVVCFFFSSRRRHTRLQGDWSSDVCSSDLSSRVTNRARSTARASLSDVPDLQNGVRQPATTATRRPFLSGITFSSQDVPRTKIGRASCRERV